VLDFEDPVQIIEGLKTFWDDVLSLLGDTNRAVLGAEHASIRAGRLMTRMPNRPTEENGKGKATADGRREKAHRLNLFIMLRSNKNRAVSPYSQGLLRGGVESFNLPFQ
jgi:hypothetical protein